MKLLDSNKDTVTLFRQQVQQTPNAIALEDLDHTYTYAELDQEVTSLARRIRSHGIGPGKLVGILLPHTADFIIACLAALRAGGAYLILELAYPPDLLNDVIENANPPVLITYALQAKSIRPGIPLIVLDESNGNVSTNGFPEDAYQLPTELDPDAMAFVSYSSGTTGLPKGIANHHRPGIVSYNQRFAVSDQEPGHRTACNTFFIWEMFRPLLRGATAFAVPDDASYDPVALVELLRLRHITETLMTPTLLASILAQFADPGALLPDLRVLWVTGEVVTTDLARRAIKALPQVRILNSYSTSETWDTSIGDMKDVLNDADQAMYCSVGPPLGLNQIYILDEEGRRLQPGETGEVHIGGPALALGYLNLPDVTAKTFVPDPFSKEPGVRMYRSGDSGRILPSGSLEITGRIGTMIKLRGYTIIPAKLQMTVVSHLAIRNCAVVSWGDGLERQLIAYFVRDTSVSKERPAIEVDKGGYSPAARRALTQYLAPYMIPAYWVEMTSLPANPVSGKIDTKRLPPPPVHSAPQIVVNRTKSSHGDNVQIGTIAEIWASVLNIPETYITSEHDFFDLGGHSLSLAVVSNKYTQVFGFRIPVVRLVDPPTLQGHLDTIRGFIDGQNSAIQTDLPRIIAADCELGDDVRSAGTQLCPLVKAENVLLTGASGFLGSFLLYDILENTTAKVLCLMRASGTKTTRRSDIEARMKLRQALTDKGLWRDTFMQRIEVVTGNLAQKSLGLDSDAYKRLAARVQVILHAGAAVNLFYPYVALRSANIGGTREILHLASLGGATVQYISTNSVLPAASSAQGWSEDDVLAMEEVATQLDSGYGQTKWVAERLAIEASHRGLPVRILRIGTLSGHSVTGVANPWDLSTALITESLQLGYAPRVKDWRIEVTPVDVVSKAIIDIANVVEPKQLIFHLGDSSPIHAEDVFIQSRDLGYSTEPLDWEDWVAAWKQNRMAVESDGQSPVDILRFDMPAVEFLKGTVVLNDAQTKKHLPQVTKPALDTSLLQNYAQHWFARDWIQKPPSTSTRAVDSASTSPVNRGPLDGRVAIITGASSGIGAATAIALAKEGVHLALAARRLPALETLKKDILSALPSTSSIQVTIHRTDVTNATQVETLVRTTVETLGRIDILVACAGVMYYTLMQNVRLADWTRTVNVNCTGLLNCLAAALPHMLPSSSPSTNALPPSPHILAISSDAGRKVFPGLGVYSASKFFVEATLQSLRLETASTGLRVTSIQPGNTETELLGLSGADEEAFKKYGEPSGAKWLKSEDVAGAIVWALRQPEYVSVNEVLIQPREEPI